MSAERKFKNDFLKNFENKEFTLEELVDMLRVIPIESYPAEIQALVRAELDYRRLQRELR